ncbi:SNF2-related protein [Mycobacterium kansasii]
MTSYTDFLSRKSRLAVPLGRDCAPSEVHPFLHPWQREIVAWAVCAGRAALWEDTGLGKTLQQLEWARLSTDRRALIVAPLAVCQQTVREAAKIGLPAAYVKHPNDIEPYEHVTVFITNYERLHLFSASSFDSVVLDESSILKQSDGKTRSMLIDWARDIPHRLACSATPAPNDPEELTNQAEWLGRMTRTHMLAAYFIHDQDGWRLKRHGREPMYQWMSQWAVALRKPSDYGGDDTGYTLPSLRIVDHVLPTNNDIIPDGQLFATEIGGVTGRAQVRRATLQARVARAAELVAAEPDESWLLWCGLNAEADALAAVIPGAVNVHGALDPDQKARLLLSFADGDIRALVTKPQIASLGMNWQHCARMAFVGLGDSYEQYYQAIRRCYRYGQQRIVQAHIILSDLESQIANNVKSKERQASEITDGLIRHTRRVREMVGA